MNELPVLTGPTSCDACGVCCVGIGSPVVLYASRPDYGDQHPYRPADLPAELIDEINLHFSGLMRGQEPQERCLWYDANAQKCRHYEFRPQICRDFELGGRSCLIARRQSGLPPAPTGPARPSPVVHGPVH